MNEICLLCKESNLDNCLKCHIFSPPKEKEKKKKNIIPRTIFRKLKKKFHEKTCKCGRAFSTTNKRRINCSDCIQEKKRIKSENRYAHLGIIIHTSPTPIEQQICNICKEPKPIDEFIGINNRKCLCCKSCREYHNERSTEYYHEKKKKKKKKKPKKIERKNKWICRETKKRTSSQPKCGRCNKPIEELEKKLWYKSKSSDVLVSAGMLDIDSSTEKFYKCCKSCREYSINNYRNKKNKKNYRDALENNSVKLAKLFIEEDELDEDELDEDEDYEYEYTFFIKEEDHSYYEKHFKKPIKEVIPKRKVIYENKTLKKLWEIHKDTFCHTCETPLGDTWKEFVNRNCRFLYDETLEKWEPYCRNCYILHTK